MKNIITQWAVYSILILLLNCSPKLILKTTIYNGKENIVAREYVYNTKTKTITTVYNNKITKNKFIIEPKQNRLFIEKLKRIGIIPKDLKTTYNKQLPFDKELKGNADIVTQDLRLIERFFYQIRKLLGYQV